MTTYPPNMTSASLFRIIEGVPLTAWPDLRYRHPKAGQPEPCAAWCTRHSRIDAADAAHAFNGSMVAWLLAEFDDIEIQVTSVGVEVTNETGHYEAHTLLEALALACKGAKHE